MSRRRISKSHWEKPPTIFFSTQFLILFNFIHIAVGDVNRFLPVPISLSLSLSVYPFLVPFLFFCHRPRPLPPLSLPVGGHNNGSNRRLSRSPPLWPAPARVSGPSSVYDSRSQLIIIVTGPPKMAKRVKNNSGSKAH